MISSFQRNENAATMRSFVIMTALLAATGVGEMQGKLILDENNISLVNLESPRNKVMLLKQPAGLRRIGGMTRVDDHSFIFSDEKPSSFEDRFIKRFDLASGEVKTLGKGGGPMVYLPERRVLFFYRWVPDGGIDYFGRPCPDEWLVAADPENIDGFTRIVPSSRTYELPIVQISPDEVVIYGEGERLWVYDFSDSRLKPTGIKNCWPGIWREKTKEFLCSDCGTEEIFLVNLVTGEKREVPKLKWAQGFIYIPDADAVVYAKECRDFSNLIYFYSFEKDEEIRVRGTYGGSFQGIWMP